MRCIIDFSALWIKLKSLKLDKNLLKSLLGKSDNEIWELF